MKYEVSDKTFHPTSQMVKACRASFERDTRIREMTARAQRLQASGHYVEAMDVLKEKEMLFDKVVAAYQELIETQVTEVKLSASGVPTEDIELINQLMVTLYMAVDIMDTCLMDINDTLHRTNKDLSFDKMDDLHEMAHLCREQLSQFSGGHKLYNQDFWGDITDNMFEMMKKKAKSIIRKSETAEKKGQKHEA